MSWSSSKLEWWAFGPTIMTLNGFDNISKSHMYAYKNDINIKQYAYIAYHPSNPHPLISLYKHGKENGI